MGEDLRRRVEELESEVARLRQTRGPRGVRYRSRAAIGDIPLLAVSMGPDFERGEMRGHARGVIAVGDMATGVVAIGGLARGLIALGGLAVGAVTFGGLALGVLGAFGGGAVAGGVAVGGGAVGRAAIGGAAYGRYACGGGAGGTYVVSPLRQDPEALAFFRRYGLERLCRR